MNNGYELSLSLLIKCLDVINEPIMGNNNSLPLIITVALPILLLNFDAPTPLCISVAKAIANVSFCEKIIKYYYQLLYLISKYSRFIKTWVFKILFGFRFIKFI